MRACLVAEAEPAYVAQGSSGPSPLDLLFLSADGARTLLAAGGGLPPAELYILPCDLLPAFKPKPAEALVFASGPQSRLSEALEQGADDYLREPWGFSELVARARLRSGSAGGSPDVVVAPGLRLRGGALVSEEARLELGGLEARLLEILVAGRGEVLGREALEEELRGASRKGSRALDALVSSLRGKLRRIRPGLETGLRAVRGRGYRLD